MKNYKEELEKIINEKGISSSIVDLENYLKNPNSKNKLLYSKMLKELKNRLFED